MPAVIAAACSLLLVCGYLRAAAGTFLFRVSVVAQTAYMVLFSYSFFFKGLTGLTLTLGGIIVLFATGLVMFFSSAFPDAIRTGATFVHDWLALAVTIVVLGHIYMAFNDATARMGMRTGSVPEAWARRGHGVWAAEELDRADPAPPSPAAPTSQRA